MTSVNITQPQHDFIYSQAIHPAMVAGYGAGKSQAAVLRIVKLALESPGLSFAFVEPTFDLVRLIAWPRFSEIFTQMGESFDLNKSESIMHVGNGSQIIFRSADNPDRMVGFEVADAVIDEIDTLKTEHASDVWSKMLARCRQKKPNGEPNTLAAASTPEGFRFVYQRWGKEKREGYELIKAPTSSNPYLPSGYIDQLKATYSQQQLLAYCDGEFVNLTAGSVYPDFDRHLNGTDATIAAREPLHIGVDFNVNNMSAAVCVIRDGRPMALDELTQIRDTPTMIQAIKSRYEGHSITVYPDASGGSMKSVNASMTDISLLRSAGFTVLAPSKNPAVKDRVMAVNNQIHNQGTRRLLVNFDRCPTLVEGLEQQAYNKSGEPDKSSGHDHLTDAIGYFISYKFNIARGSVGIARITGI